MPWEETGVMKERFRLIERWKESDEGIADLARRSVVSHKTVCKWLERYQLGGMEELADRSRRPLVQASRTLTEMEQWILDLRCTKRSFLMRRQPEQPWPAESAVALILSRNDPTTKQRRRRRATPSEHPVAHAREPNDVWSIDFKSCLQYGNGRRCDPLTLSNGASRYLPCCQAIEGTGTSFAMA